ncbi:MAG: precorrin-6A reductase [Proteobacteria bacterium]|nr:MAG: precorrin-6A reductase [Pseudomonadota bacterium]
MKLLILAGTAEARELAARLPGHDVLLSLAGSTRRPQDLPAPVRIGGFGGAQGQRDFLRAGGFDAVIDATHPFAARIGPRSAAICAELGLPYLRLLRPSWPLEPGWHAVASEAEVGAALAGLLPEGGPVFFATGPQSFAAISLPPEIHPIVRRVDPPDAPLAGGEWLVARPPFSRAEEVATLRNCGARALVCKNAGGAAGRAKLEAARELSLPVVMIERPAAPAGVASVAEAVMWVEERDATH